MCLLSSWCRNAATAGNRVGGRMLLVTWKRKRGAVRSPKELSVDSWWQRAGRDKGKGGYEGKEKAIVKRQFLSLMCLTHLLNFRDSRGLRKSKSKQQVKKQRGYSPDGASYPSQAEPFEGGFRELSPRWGMWISGSCACPSGLGSLLVSYCDLGGFHTSAVCQAVLPAPVWVHFASAKCQRTFWL